MAEGGNYSNSIHRDVEEDCIRSLPNGSEEDNDRSLIYGSDEYASRSITAGSDDYDSRSMMVGSDDFHSRSMIRGSDEFHIGSIDDESNENDINSDSGDESDELQNNQCEPCKKAGTSTTAVKYCENCPEYLCGQCFSNHARFKAFKDHKIQSITNASSTNTKRVIENSKYKQAELNHRRRAAQSNFSSEAEIKVEAKLLSIINLSTGKDKEKPITAGITLVQTHYCVVTDDKNKSIKVIDTRRRRVASEKSISEAESLWSLTAVNDEQVAVSVSFKGKGQIVFFLVSSSGIISHTNRTIEVGYSLYGMIYSNERFYATDGFDIYVISVQGEILKKISNTLFYWLRGIAISNDDSTLYVCSYGNDTVLSLDLNGNVKDMYKERDVERPWGITLDRLGYVHVCSYGKKAVTRLTGDLNMVQTIIEDVDVKNCTVDKRENKLYLAFCSDIKVFSLSYQ